jgi:hypothetical protein
MSVINLLFDEYVDARNTALICGMIGGFLLLGVGYMYAAEHLLIG